MKIIPEDIDLVIKLQKGDVEAFDLVYAKYAGKLYGFAFKYLKSKAETEELVQSVFLKVWENHKSLRKESSFKSYHLRRDFHGDDGSCFALPGDRSGEP